MIARVFPRRTSYTPTDSLAFVGDPPLWLPDVDEVSALASRNRLAQQIDDVPVQATLVIPRPFGQRRVNVGRQAEDQTDQLFSHGSSIHHLDITSLLWYHSDTTMIPHTERGDAMESEGKRCSKCGEWKPSADYHRKSKAKDGLQSRCKTCIHLDSAGYYARNAEHIKVKSHQWYTEHSDYWKEKVRSYESNHREQVRESRRLAALRRRRSDPERYRVYGRNHYRANADVLRLRRRQWHASHLKQDRAINRRWYTTHHDHVISKNAERRAAKRAAVIEKVSRQEIFRRDRGVCHICHKKVNPRKWHLDHLVPLSKGGKHCRINVAVSHPTCNMRRHNTGPAQLRMLP